MPRLNICMSNSYKTTCPECGGKNFAVTESKGIAHCFNCQYTQRLNGNNAPIKVLARSKRKEEIRAYYLELCNYWHSCLTDEHRAWLYRRGVSDYSINTLKLGYCPPSYHPLYSSDIAAEAGVFYKDHIQLADRITFPFFAEGQITDFYGRTLDPSVETKYLGLFGGAWKRHADYAYMHDYAYKHSAFKRLVRTEGLLKAVISNQYGVACIAYPGTLAFRPNTQPLAGQKQVICFDNQRQHRRELIYAIKREAERYTDPFIATLPLRNKDKQDIDSYILGYGVEDYLRVIGGALTYAEWLNLVK